MRKMTGEIETRRRAIEVIGNLTAFLGLLVLGFPLTPSTIRSLLLGWILAVLATIQFVWGNVHAAPSVSMGVRPNARRTTLLWSRETVVGSLRGRR